MWEISVYMDGLSMRRHAVHIIQPKWTGLL